MGLMLGPLKPIWALRGVKFGPAGPHFVLLGVRIFENRSKSLPNRFKKCDAKNCKRQHVCQICFAKKHPWYNCPKYLEELKQLGRKPS